MTYSTVLTLVASLKLRLLKKASNVLHHAVTLGAACTKSRSTNPSMLRSTARDGSNGAHGNKPIPRSCNAGSLQVHRTIFSMPEEQSSVGTEDLVVDQLTFKVDA